MDDIYDGQNDKSYLKKLYQLAVNYLEGDLHFDEVSFFYRNKPKEYFEEVKKNNNTVKKIRKDFNGDPKSPINNHLEGIFLGVTLHMGQLPTISPFGDTRLHIPIKAIFDKSTNLYFTDFYCTTSANHHVTLVLTKQDSSEDRFCKKNLLKLDPLDNPFLRMHYNCFSEARFTTARSGSFYVEIFYTEEINLNDLLKEYGPEKVFFNKTNIVGKGHSTMGGLPKDSSCFVCNPACEYRGHSSKFKPTANPQLWGTSWLLDQFDQYEYDQFDQYEYDQYDQYEYDLY